MLTREFSSNFFPLDLKSNARRTLCFGYSCCHDVICELSTDVQFTECLRSHGEIDPFKYSNLIIVAGETHASIPQCPSLCTYRPFNSSLCFTGSPQIRSQSVISVTDLILLSVNPRSKLKRYAGRRKTRFSNNYAMMRYITYTE